MDGFLLVDYEENENSTTTRYGDILNVLSSSTPGPSYRRSHFELNDCDDSFDSVFALDSVTSSQNEYGIESRPRTVPSKNLPQAKIVALKNEKLRLCCEWGDCSYVVSAIEDFLRHVAHHVPDLEVRENIQGEEVYGCLWSGCGFETADPKEVKRHVNFHSYHTKIKSIGENILGRVPDINSCCFDSSAKNEIPDLPDPFVCDWNKCGRVFTNPQLYYFHVSEHIRQTHKTNDSNAKASVPCRWTHCSSSFRTIHRLTDHLRTHTQEKYAACPTCGAFFASSTKLVDHIRRQTSAGQSYQCSHCSKYFPSERLLRDHMRHHVNHYKCTFCDMTCPTPSALSLHIRYKHLHDKPFKCHMCSYRTKTKYDLNVHMASHTRGNKYECEEKGCDFKCRSLYGLNKHLRKIHGDDEPTYCCHLCDVRFLRGTYLTNHLFKVHNIRWPNGHCRFRYKLDESGLYRLETVRYESLEVTQEMLRAESLTSQQPEGSLRETQSKSKSVHITITQLDELGNVVEANEVESEVLSTLPVGETTIIQEGAQFID